MAAIRNHLGRTALTIATLFILMFTSCGQSAKHDDTVTTRGHKLISMPASVPLSEAERKRIYDESEQWFDTILKNTGFNGGVLVAKGGAIVYEKYRGLKRLNGIDSVDAETPFHIASVSKTITAMATLKLWQDGKISLDDAYSKYFPEFNYPGVTIKTLLNHRSGLPNYLYFMEKLWPNKKLHITNEDVLHYLVIRKTDMNNIAPPDTRFSYCNTNYALLALLIEKVTGQKFPQYIQDTFFAPLQMTHTFVYTPADSAGLPPNYDYRSREIPIMFLDDVYGDKNVYSTPRDLLKWDRALKPGVMFTPQTLAAAYAPYSNEKDGVKNYGLGWRMNKFPNGKKMIFHNGWWHGNNASFIRLFDEDATIIVVNNRYTNATYKAKLLVNIFSHYFDKPTEEESEAPLQLTSLSPEKKAELKAPATKATPAKIKQVKKKN